MYVNAEIIIERNHLRSVQIISHFINTNSSPARNVSNRVWTIMFNSILWIAKRTCSACVFDLFAISLVDNELPVRNGLSLSHSVQTRVCRVFANGKEAWKLHAYNNTRLLWMASVRARVGDAPSAALILSSLSLSLLAFAAGAGAVWMNVGWALSCSAHQPPALSISRVYTHVLLCSINTANTFTCNPAFQFHRRNANNIELIPAQRVCCCILLADCFLCADIQFAVKTFNQSRVIAFGAELFQ